MILWGTNLPKAKTALGFLMGMKEEKKVSEMLSAKITDVKKNVRLFAINKKLFGGILIVVLLFITIGIFRGRKSPTTAQSVKSITQKVEKSYDFPALGNNGKTAPSKIKFKIVSAEKTNQVLVKDQTFTAKNRKLFLIVNIELKNDATSALNIVPGDLIRLSFGADDNKYAPDLHNNLVLVSALSTKVDRVGFVIPEDTSEFKFIVGELEGKKEEIKITFPS